MRLIFAVLVAVFSLYSPAVAAEPPPSDALAAAARSWKGHWTPPDRARLPAARAELRAAMEAIPEHGRDRLPYAELEKQLDALDVDAHALRPLYDALPVPRPQFKRLVRFRAAVREFRDAAWFWQLSCAQDEFDRQLEELATFIERFGRDHRAADRAEILKRVEWLEAGRLALELADAVRLVYFAAP